MDLLMVEKDLVSSLKDYISAEEEKLQRLKQWDAFMLLSAGVRKHHLPAGRAVYLCVFTSRWAERLDVLSAASSEDPEGFLGHPVNAFKLVKRLNTEWAELESLVLTDMSDGVCLSPEAFWFSKPAEVPMCSFRFFFFFTNMLCGVSAFISNLTIQRQFFPNDEDQAGAAKALMRLQDTYQLETSIISSGQLPGLWNLTETVPRCPQNPGFSLSFL